ncbi:hypothetical protein EAS64_14800 [Trebonia kvetii]|uniref:NACHT domain-containing protein n=1 Tax=Trebonia kvetii TaxID=2480626 RepID=A0A6P2BXD5_9ACTN|nr:hypothetical protein [Trebonia kvetii]TVZ03734.1 hypothetical protein EAS64_14800 [Trebonia kvetii]
MVAMLALVSGVALPVVTWFALKSDHDWSIDEKLAIVGIIASIGAGIASTVAGPGFTQWLAEITDKHPSKQGELHDPAHSQIKWLRTQILSRRLYGPHSTLERQGVVGDLFNLNSKSFSISESGRLVVRGRKFLVTQIAEIWSQDPRRMVILGEPGYGKTTTALVLLGQINSVNDRALPVAELFPLSEWYRWQIFRSSPQIDDWIAARLAQEYPELGSGTAKALVEQGSILPLFDGFDEIPATKREECRRAIEAYAGRTVPFRPFVLTSRVGDFLEVPDSWISTDQRVILLGLEAEQVIRALHSLSARSTGWKRICEDLRDADQRLLEIFTSPLRFSIATQVYKYSDPTELRGLDVSAARDVLWQRFLQENGGVFGYDGAQDVQRWLGTIASWMDESSSQSFSLTDIFRHADKSQLKSARLIQNIFAAIPSGLIAGFVAMAYGATLTAVIAGLAAGIGAWYAPSFAKLIFELNDAELGGCAEGFLSFVPAWFAAIGTWLSAFYRFGAPGALVPSLIVFWYACSTLSLFYAMLPEPVAVKKMREKSRKNSQRKTSNNRRSSVIEVLRDDPALLLLSPIFYFIFFISVFSIYASRLSLYPARMVGNLSARLIGYIAPRSRRRNNKGLAERTISPSAVGDVSFVILQCAAAAVVLALVIKHYIPESITAGIAAVTLSLSICYAFFSRFGRFFNLYLIERSFAREGQLPADLKGFLDWCSEPERSWLRRFVGYNLQYEYSFRHRDLLEYLARSYRSLGQ